MSRSPLAGPDRPGPGEHRRAGSLRADGIATRHAVTGSDTPTDLLLHARPAPPEPAPVALDPPELAMPESDPPVPAPPDLAPPVPVLAPPELAVSELALHVPVASASAPYVLVAALPARV